MNTRHDSILTGPVTDAPHHPATRTRCTGHPDTEVDTGSCTAYPDGMADTNTHTTWPAPNPEAIGERTGILFIARRHSDALTVNRMLAAATGMTVADVARKRHRELCELFEDYRRAIPPDDTGRTEHRDTAIYMIGRMAAAYDLYTAAMADRKRCPLPAPQYPQLFSTDTDNALSIEFDRIIPGLHHQWDAYRAGEWCAEVSYAARLRGIGFPAAEVAR